MIVYLDHHAASPPSDAVRRAMAEALETAWANPSSVHAPGRATRAVFEGARDAVAASIGAKPADVVLTGGGTEACNLGVLGLFDRSDSLRGDSLRGDSERGDSERGDSERGDSERSLAGARGHVVVTAGAHPATARALEALGVPVVLPMPDGRAPTVDALDAALEGAALVALTWVNHETGSVVDAPALAAACRARGVPVFVDATQALGKLPIDVASLGATAVALAASKIGGPAGAGALWIDRDAELHPRIVGGTQERGRRAGTPDVMAAAGFGAAAREVAARLRAIPEIARRRDALEATMIELGATPVGAAGTRVATVTMTTVPGWRGRSLVAALDLEGLATSSGAACSSGVDAPSEVVAAMLPDEPERARAALRLSLGPSTTDADVEAARAILRRVVPRNRFE